MLPYPHLKAFQIGIVAPIHYISALGAGPQPPLFYRFQICVAGYIVRRIACSASPIVRYPQERADFFRRLAHLNRILIAGYADEGVSVLMRAERADVFNLNVAFNSAPTSYHDPVFTHLYSPSVFHLQSCCRTADRSRVADYRCRLGGQHQPHDFDRGLAAVSRYLGQRQLGVLSHVALGGKHYRSSCTEDHRGDRRGVGKRGKVPAIEVQRKANFLLPCPDAHQIGEFWPCRHAGHLGGSMEVR